MRKKKRNKWSNILENCLESKRQEKMNTEGVMSTITLHTSTGESGILTRKSIALFAIRIVTHVGTEDAVRTAYDSLFMCHLRYGIVLGMLWQMETWSVFCSLKKSYQNTG
ncbi:hypothetical protein J6590_051740 [Homalodisca vitripennis]|nr:hypothetical protein J6590_051740 [Homalodisca vitripennis]